VRLARITRAATAVAAAALVWAGSAAAGSAAAASIGGFGARPAHFDPAVPATRAYFIRRLAPGGSFRDEVIAFNSGSAALRLRVYPVDGLTGATSGVVYGNRGVPLTGAGAWITVAAPTVIVPPHSQVSVPFTAQAPVGAASGVHLAGLALEEADPSTSGGRFSVTEILRTVVGIEMILPGPDRPQIALRSVHPVTGPGATFVVGVGNVGTGLCKPDLLLRVTDSRGSHQVTHRLDTLLPGDTIPYAVAWPRRLTSGRYAEQVIATGCGSSRALNATASIGHPEAAGGQPATAQARIVSAAASSSTPWPLILLVGAGGIGFGVLLSRGRRRGQRRA
jgi:hypothetical protein